MSNLGNVKSLDRIEAHKTRWGQDINFSHTGKVLQQRTTYEGYYKVPLTVRGRCVHQNVHRLVASAFLPNPQKLPCVNHKDCNTKNNCVDNLEWCDYSYNSQYMFKQGRARGSVKPSRRVRNSLGEDFDSICEAARQYGSKTLASQISRCCRGLKKKAAGLSWEYLSDTPHKS